MVLNPIDSLFQGIGFPDDIAKGGLVPLIQILSKGGELLTEVQGTSIYFPPRISNMIFEIWMQMPHIFITEKTFFLFLT